MGATASSAFYLPTCHGVSQPTMCMVSFPSCVKCDELSLLYGSGGQLSALRLAVERNWPKGIDADREMRDNFGGFKLNGRPFGENLTNSSRHGIAVARMMCSMIEEMMKSGFALKSTINFCRQTKSDSYLFGAQVRDDLLPRVSALDLQSSDQVHLIGLPRKLYGVVEGIITEHWPNGLKKHKMYEETGDCKFIFKGYPWRAASIHENLANSRMVVLQIIRAICREGFVLIGSGHPGQSVEEVDTLYFAEAAKPQALGESFMFGMQNHDYVFTIDAPAACVDAIRECVQTAWPDGLNTGENIGAMTAMKLHGYPWQASRHNAVYARLLLIRMLEKLRSVGWKLYGTVDMNKNLNDASCFVMVKCAPEARHFMALKLCISTSLRLINAPPDVAEGLSALLSNIWPGGFTEKESYGCASFKFNKSLKDCQGIFCYIIEKVESLGWSLVSSADLSVKYYADRHTKIPLDLHTLIFEKESGDSGAASP